MTNLTYNGNQIEQREQDGYVNLTQMSKATGKKIGHWTTLEKTAAYIDAVATDTGIPTSQLLYPIKGGDPNKQGTWAHPLIALQFAQWISPEFHVWCNNHIRTLIETGETSIAPKIPQTYQEALLEAARLEGERLRLEAEKELLETENQILQNANNELSEVMDELFDYSSIIRVAKFNKCSEKCFKWSKLKAVCSTLGLSIKKAPCPRFGEKNLYPHEAWRVAYPEINLPETTTLKIVNNT